jgi:uncharacterized membrane protein
MCLAWYLENCANLEVAQLMLIDAAHRRWWQIFEVVFGIPFFVALALQYVRQVCCRLAFLHPSPWCLV